MAWYCIYLAEFQVVIYGSSRAWKPAVAVVPSLNMGWQLWRNILISQCFTYSARWICIRRLDFPLFCFFAQIVQSLSTMEINNGRNDHAVEGNLSCDVSHFMPVKVRDQVWKLYVQLTPWMCTQGNRINTTRIVITNQHTTCILSQYAAAQDTDTDFMFKYAYLLICCYVNLWVF